MQLKQALVLLELDVSQLLALIPVITSLLFLAKKNHVKERKNRKFSMFQIFRASAAR